MAEVIVFPRPINRVLSDGADDDQTGAAMLRRLDSAIARLLASNEVWHAGIDELLLRLDELGDFIESLDESDTKGALRESHAAIRRALNLTGNGLRLQFQILSGLRPEPFDSAIEATEPVTGSRSIRSAIASWFGTRIWPF